MRQRQIVLPGLGILMLGASLIMAAAGSAEGQVTPNPNPVGRPYVTVVNEDPIPVEGEMSISGTADVNVTNTPSVNVANTPNVSVANMPSVSVDNTPDVVVANTPDVNVANTASVSVDNTPDVVVANTPDVNVANTPDVNIVGTPKVSVSGTVSVDSLPPVSIADLGEPISIDLTEGYTVPEGKILIADMVSFSASQDELSGDQHNILGVSLYIDGFPHPVPADIQLLFGGAGGDRFVEYRGAVSSNIRVAAGSSIFMDFDFVLGGVGSFEATLRGRLVDVP